MTIDSMPDPPPEDDDDEAPPSSPLARIALAKAPVEDGMTAAVKSRRSIRPSSPSAPPRKVLLVARDALARASLARDLMIAGCEVRTVAPGDIATCRDSTYEVIVVAAPDREARAAVGTVRRWFPTSPLLIHSDPSTSAPISTREGARQETVSRNATLEEIVAALDRLREPSA